MSNLILKKEFEYFVNNLPELIKNYKGKYIVIKNEKVIGVYSDIEAAIIETKKTEELGTFLIQKCEDDKESYTQTYHSRVSFSV